METKAKSKTAERELTISRLLNAPIELVWEVWTNPEHIKHWWGPNGFTNTIYKMDVKPGGEWDLMMHGPDGTDFWNKHTYTEVVKHEKLVHVHGEPKFEMTTTFTAQGNKTLVTIVSIFESAEVLKKAAEEFGAIEGFKQNADRLEKYVNNLPAERELVILRQFNAPRELVFKAWTEPERLAKWWGPKGADISVSKLELKPGGMFLYSMKNPNGEDVWGKFVYHEIAAPEKLVFVNSFSDKDGGTARNPWMPVWPLEVMNTVTLIEHEGKTTLTIKGKPINATPEEIKNFNSFRDSMETGFAGTFEQLEEYLKGKLGIGNYKSETNNNMKTEERRVVITRVLDAPRELVWEAWTDPKHFAQWWGPHGFTAPTCEMDLRPGGSLRIHMEHPDFPNHWMRGTFKEIVPPEKLVFTSGAFIGDDGEAGFEGINTITFEDLGEKTKLTVNALVTKLAPEFSSAYEGTNEGLNQSLDKLTTYINYLK